MRTRYRMGLRSLLIVTGSVWSSAFFFFSSRRRHTRLQGDWSSDVCSSDLLTKIEQEHTASGKHVNHETPAAQWLPKGKLPAVEEALRELGPLAESVLFSETDRKSVV